MVTSNNFKNDSGEDLPNFSDPEDYEDNISNEGKWIIIEILLQIINIKITYYMLFHLIFDVYRSEFIILFMDNYKLNLKK